MTTFSTQLKSARLAAGLSQARAAAQCGLSLRGYRNFETGEQTPATEAEAVTQERLLARLAAPTVQVGEGASPSYHNAMHPEDYCHIP